MLKLSWTATCRSAACAKAPVGSETCERTAINTVIQGSAADLIKRAMVAKIHHRMRTERLSVRMLLQIHDELIFEVPTDQLHHLAKLVTEEWSAPARLKVP